MYHSLKYVLVLICLLMTGVAAVYADDDAGTSGMTFLKIIPFPTAGAMGAQVACAQGNEALYFNPAGLAATPSFEATMVHNSWMGMADYEYLGAAMPVEIGDGAGVGGAISYLSTDDIPRTTVADPNGFQTGSFNASEFMLTFGYGQKLGDYVELGGNYHFIQERIWTHNRQGHAFDIGARVHPGIEGLTLGGSFLFFGPDIDVFVDREDKLPTTYILGAAYTLNIWKNPLTIAIDSVKPRDETWYGNVGLSYELGKYAIVRGGYSSKHDIGNGLTVGFGVRDGEHWYCDYSYTPAGHLGQTNRISLTYRY